MKKSEVRIGGFYSAKVSGAKVPVRIDRESVYGGYMGTNMYTGREIRIMTAARLHLELSEASVDFMVKLHHERILDKINS